MKSKIQFFILIVAALISLLFQNCTRLTSFSPINSNTLESPFSFATIVSENNGEGYLGKLQMNAYVKSYLNFTCGGIPEAMSSKNIQGITRVENGQLIVTQDNCMDMSYKFALEDPRLDIQAYNPDFFMLATVPYEKKVIFDEEEQKATEVFCRNANEFEGIDIVLKYESETVSSAKIYMGNKGTEEDAPWVLKKVQPFPVQREFSQSTSSLKFTTTSFRLSINDMSSETGLHSALLDVTIDSTHKQQSLNCYVMNKASTVTVAEDLSLLANFPFNNGFNDVINDVQSLANFPAQVTFVPGRFNSALRFDGSENNIVLQNAPQFNNLQEMTISVWVKPESAGTIIRKSNTFNSPSIGWVLAIENQDSMHLVFQAGFQGGFMSAQTSSALISGEWNHIVLAWNGQNDVEGVQIFINGSQVFHQLQQPSSNNSRPDDSEYPVTIADSYSENSKTLLFSGDLDQLAIWSRALNSIEVEFLYNNGIPFP